MSPPGGRRRAATSQDNELNERHKLSSKMQSGWRGKRNGAYFASGTRQASGVQVSLGHTSVW
jgi:hypothetical protein